MGINASLFANPMNDAIDAREFYKVKRLEYHPKMKKSLVHYREYVRILGVEDPTEEQIQLMSGLVLPLYDLLDYKLNKTDKFSSFKNMIFLGYF